MNLKPNYEPIPYAGPGPIRMPGRTTRPNPSPINQPTVPPARK